MRYFYLIQSNCCCVFINFVPDIILVSLQTLLLILQVRNCNFHFIDEEIKDKVKQINYTEEIYGMAKVIYLILKPTISNYYKLPVWNMLAFWLLHSIRLTGFANSTWATDKKNSTTFMSSFFF